DRGGVDILKGRVAGIAPDRLLARRGGLRRFGLHGVGLDRRRILEMMVRVVAGIVARLVLVAHRGSVPQPLPAVFAAKRYNVIKPRARLRSPRRRVHKGARRSGSGESASRDPPGSAAPDVR